MILLFSLSVTLNASAGLYSKIFQYSYTIDGFQGGRSQAPITIPGANEKDATRFLRKMMGLGSRLHILQVREKS